MKREGVRVIYLRLSMYQDQTFRSRVLKRLPLCLPRFRFAFYEHVCTFDEKEFIFIHIWDFKENLKNLASSTSEINQLTRLDKKNNPQGRESRSSRSIQEVKI